LFLRRNNLAHVSKIWRVASNATMVGGAFANNYAWLRRSRAAIAGHWRVRIALGMIRFWMLLVSICMKLKLL
jgi:hypothetical protein